MPREPVQETPILPGQFDDPATADLAVVLRAIFAEYGMVINDDLVTISDWNTEITGATYAMNDTDRFIFADATAAPIAVTLPLAANAEPHFYCVKKTDASGNAVTVGRAGSDLIDGATSKSLASRYDLILLVTDRVATWHILHLGTP